MRKIGIYSGSFDPVHEGHVAFAMEAMRACSLDGVVFMPERFPRDKPTVSPVSERIANLENVLTETQFSILDVHTDIFTVATTLPELETLYPGSKLTLLIGSDVVLGLASWENIEELVAKVDFVVGMRAGSEEKTVTSTLQALGARYTLLTTDQSHVSSSSLRIRG